MSAVAICRHCGFAIACNHLDEHGGLCCDCFDLSHGMPLSAINRERAARNEPPIAKPWPRRS